MMQLILGDQPDWAKFAVVEVYVTWEAADPTGPTEGKYSRKKTQSEVFDLEKHAEILKRLTAPVNEVQNNDA